MIKRKKGFVYLLHYDSKLHKAQHYLGWAMKGNLKARIEKHRKGMGANLTKAFQRNGIDFKVARVWRHATLLTERRLRDRHNNPKLCPICKKEITK